MFVEESLWIKDRLREVELPPGAVALDVGSSTFEYRTVEQPHIERNVTGPLRERGVEVRSLDFRDDPDIDYRWDQTAPDFDHVLVSRRPPPDPGTRFRRAGAVPAAAATLARELCRPATIRR